MFTETINDADDDIETRINIRLCETEFTQAAQRVLAGQDGGESSHLLLAEEAGQWTILTNSRKRHRGSSSNSQMSVHDFKSLTVDYKLSVLFSEISVMHHQHIDECVALQSKVCNLETPWGQTYSVGIQVPRSRGSQQAK